LAVTQKASLRAGWVDTEEMAMSLIKKRISRRSRSHPIKEQVQNFERGLDPMKAMKIGKNTLPYKKGDKVRVWVSWEKRFVEVRVYEDEELDTDNNPKIKKMISNAKPAWEVRRIWVRYNGEVRTANLILNPNSPQEDEWILHQ
jgi:hypothetical protein